MKKEYKILLSGIFGCGLIYMMFAYLEMTILGFGITLGVAGIYLGTLYRSVKDKIASQREYKIMAGVLAYLFLINLSFGALQMNNADNQRQFLVDIRETIETNLISIEAHQSMLKTLRTYHHDNPGYEKSIVQIFEEEMGHKLNDDGSFISDLNPSDADQDSGDRAFDAYYEYPSEDEVRIIAVANITKGEDLDFDNYNEKIGHYEIQASLTERGINYERVN